MRSNVAPSAARLTIVRFGCSAAISPARLACGVLAPVPTPVLSPTISRRFFGSGGATCSGVLRRASQADCESRTAV